MANKRIEINLQFNADTTGAKARLNELETQLNRLANATRGDLVDDKSLVDAKIAAMDLQKVLDGVVNIKTGKMDLSKFSDNLKTSGQSLGGLQKNLLALGPAGAKTFNALSDAISAAEIPSKRLGEKMQELGKTLANTVRWQISSNLVDGFTKALSEAVDYSKDLNKSINDIRIVTGYSVDDMKDFAAQANKAAKALSTTTNEYAKASLIFYQQGLSESEVKARTETTIKMANVTGDSAEKVSSYMTGIWNNFDDGSKSIESYADVITKLGAATASASDEIAEGLQKFSAVADTVGLSYNYAATAMATVSAQTRESADVIGTSFKTILARLESLSLGETLDDDTTLTQYSAALATVGVNIKDQSGQLKNMDNILDELGEKWTSISRDQQVALAQTVAGMRQYNNFIALLDNYDTFKVNLEIAESSEGSLQEQADIYAESWEAAEERVQASLETLYESLLDDKFFIGIYDGVAKVIDGVKNLTSTMGGMQGVLSLISSILLKSFGSQLAEGINNSIYNIGSFFGITQKKAEKMKESLLELKKAKREESLTGEEGSEERKASGKIYDKRLDLEEKILNKDNKYSDNQVNNFKIELERYKEYSDVQIAAAKRVDDTRRAIEENNKALEEQKSRVDEAAEAQENYKKQLEAIQEQKAEQQKAAGSKRAATVQEQLDESETLQTAISSSLLSKKQASDIAGTKQQAENIDAIKKEVLEAFQNYVSKDLDTQTSAESIKEFQENLDSIIAEAENVGSEEANALITFLKERKATLTQTQGGEDRKQRASKEISEMLNTKGGLAGAIDEGIYKEFEEVIRKAIGEKTGLSSVAKNYSSETIRKIIDEITKATRSTKIVGEEGSEEAALKVAELTEEEKKLIKELEKAGEAAKAAKKGQEELEKGAETLNNALEKEEEQLKDIDDAMSNLNPNKNNLFTWKDVAPMFVETATALTSVNSILQSVKGAWETFKNPDLSFWEKLIAILTTLSTAIFTVKRAYEAFASVAKTINQITETLAIKANTDARKENAEATDEQTKSQRKKNAETSEEIVSNGVETVQEKTKSGGKLKALVSKWKSSSSNSALMKAGPYMIAIAAAVASVVVAIKLSQKILEEEENAAAEAAQRANKLAEAAENLKSQYEEQKSLASDYLETSKSLETLTKGTVEYAEALSEANDQAMELIEANKDLEYTIENGQIVIDEDSLEAAQENKLAEYQQAQAQAQFAKIEANDAQAKADATSGVRDSMGSTNTVGSAIALGTEGAAAGALIGTAIFPGFGTIIGGIIGAAGGALGGIAAADAVEDARAEQLQQIAELYKEDNSILADKESFSAALRENNLYLDSNYFETITDDMSELKKTCEEINENTANNQLYYQQAVNNLNAGNEQYSNSKYRSALDELKAEELESSITDEKIKETIKKHKGDDAFWKDVTNFGLNADEYRIKDTGGGNVTLQKKNAETGKWEADTVIGDEDDKNGKNNVSKETLARRYLLNQIGTFEAEELNDAIANYDNWIKALGANGLDDNLQNNLVASIQKGEADLSDLTPEQIAAIDYNRLNAEDAKIVQEGAENAAEARSNLIDDYDSSISGFLSRLTTLSNNTLQMVGDSLQSLYLAGGKGLATETEAVLNDLVAAAPDQADKIYSLFSSLDWSDTETAINQLQAGMYDLGVDVEEQISHWDFFAEKLKSLGVNALTYSFETLKKTLKEVSDIADDFEFGKVISDDDYETLMNYNASLQEYFILTKDGYKFIGDEEKISEKLNKSLKDRLKSQLEVNKIVKDNSENILGLTTSGVTIEDYKSNLEELKKTFDADTFKKIYGMDLSSLEAETERGNLETLKTLWEDIEKVRTNYAAGSYADNEAYELFLSEIDSVKELKELYEEFGGEANKEITNAYQKQLSYLEKSSEELAKELKYTEKLTNEIERCNRSITKLQKLQSNRIGEAAINAALKQSELYKQIAEDNTALATNSYAKLAEEIKKFEEEHSGVTVSLLEDGSVNFTKLISDIKEAGLSSVDLDAIQEASDEYINYTTSAEEALESSLDVILAAFGTKLQEEIDSIDFEASLRDALNAFNTSGKFKQKIILEAEFENFEDIQKKVASTANTLNQQAAEILGKSVEEVTEADWVLAAATNATVKEQLDSYKEYQVELISSAKDFTDEITTQIESFFADVREEYEDVAEAIEEINTLTSAYKGIVDTVGKKNLGITNDQLRDLNQKSIEATRLGLENLKNEADAQATLLEQLETALSAGDRSQLDSKYANYTDEQLQEVIEKEKEQLEELNTSLVTSLDSALSSVVNLYTEDLELFAEEFEESVAGAAGSLDWLASQFERQTELSDLYLKDYEKVYELSKLRRQIEKSIDSASSIKSQRALRDLAAEITSLESSGAKVSAYQLEMLQKRYELKLAEANLESGQAGQYQMVLRRNENGDWSYEYSAVEEAEDALQSYEDAQYALVDTNQTHLNDLQSGLISLQSNLKDDLLEIAEDMTLSTEEKQERMRELMEYYNEQLGYYEDELKLTLGDSQALFNMNKNVVSTWAETLYNKITGGSDSITEAFKALDQGAAEFVSQTKTAMDEYFGTEGAEGYLNKLINATGVNINDFVDTTLDNKMNTAKEKVENALNGMDTSGWSEKLAEITDLVSQWTDNISKAIAPLAKKLNDIAALSGYAVVYQSYIDNNPNEDIYDDWYDTKELNTAASNQNAKVLQKQVDLWNAYSTGDEDKIAEAQKGYETALTDRTDFQDIAVVADEAIAKVRKKGFYSDGDEEYNVLDNLKSDYENKIEELESAISGEEWALAQQYAEEASDILKQKEKSLKNIELANKLIEGRYLYQGEAGKLASKENIIWDGQSNLYKYEVSSNNYIDLNISDWEQSSVEPSSAPEAPSYIRKTWWEDGTIGLATVASSAAFSTDRSTETQSASSNAYTGMGTNQVLVSFEDTQNIKENNPWVRVHSINGTPLYIKKSYLDNVYSIPNSSGIESSPKLLALYDNFIPSRSGIKSSPNVLVPYDTGGYTGEWDSSGKLAVLHQKELVLNAEDTSNILSAVDIIRQVAKVIDLGAMRAAQLSGALSLPSLGESAQTLQQEVTIHAEFPNATDHNEIEEAFNQLINHTAQFISRS